uniref:Uncharacterized protein n=1 Tax=Euplotes crassus TaxID=5936 RepID=A0A7S3NV36_EUPCR|mmetsp:Transcript_20512/g.20254  ORF Transcript_20512/g.20254 Transcript_20512/m.20254 type:complete len:146 (+) Transcript_20512:665-1102(+)
MKKFYMKEFKNYLRNLDTHASGTLTQKRLALGQAMECLQEKFMIPIPEHSNHFLLALVDLKGILYEETALFPRLEEKVKDLCRSFTSKKLKDLLRLRPFAGLLLNFLSQQSEIRAIISNSKDDETSKEAFRDHTSALRHLAESYF